MPKSGIYAIENTVNGKTYIGSAASLVGRRRSHFSMLRRHTHCNRHLQRSYDKHGESAFRFAVLAYCDPGDLVRLEQSFIDGFRPEYNIAKDARAPMLGRRHTKDAKKRISAGGRGQRRSEETRRRISAAQKGQKRGPLPESTRRKISEAMQGNTHCLGNKLSEEHRRKISEAGVGNTRSLGHHPSAETRRRMSAAAMGNKNSLGIHPSEETRRKLSEAGTRRVYSENDRRAISEGLMGRPVSEETRRKISAALRGKGKPWSPARRDAWEAKRDC